MSTTDQNKNIELWEQILSKRPTFFRPMPPYFLFCQEERSKAGEKDPEIRLKTVDLARRWLEIRNTLQTDKYKKAYEEARARYIASKNKK